MRRLALACCLVAGCTPGGGRASNAIPAAPPSLRYQADSVSYFLAGHRRVEQEFQGEATTQHLELGIWIRSILTPGTADTLAAHLVLDSVAESGAGATVGDLEALRGATWTARLAPTGQLLDFAGPADPGIANQLFNALREFYPRLPAQGVTPGDTWVDTVHSAVDAGGVTLTMRAVRRSVAMGLQPWDGGQAFQIRVTTDYTITGEGSQSGQPLTMDGTGRRHTQEYLSPTGRYVGNVVADTSSHEVLLTALGMSIPGRQWRYDTLRVVP